MVDETAYGTQSKGWQSSNRLDVDNLYIAHLFYKTLVFSVILYIILLLFYLVKNKMTKTILVALIIWALLVALAYNLPAKAGEVSSFNQFMAEQVYSVYLERANYLHEVDMWLLEYNPNLDKSLGIQIDNLCQARGRTPKQCWLQMVYEVGGEYRPFRWF